MTDSRINKRGVTLTEVLVGILILAIIGTTIYHFMSGARRLSSIAATKATLRQEALLILKNMEKDIANSRTKTTKDGGKNKVEKTLKYSGNGSFEMEVASKVLDKNGTFFDQTLDSENKTFSKVSYALQGSKFFRTGDGKTKCLSTNVTEAKLEETADGGVDETYDGKVKLLLTLEAKPAGVPDKIKHVERAIIAVRQAQTKETDVEWKQRTDASDPSTY